MSAELSEHDAKLIVDAAIAAGRSGPGVLISTVQRVIDEHERAVLRSAAEAMRQAERDGYLWLDAARPERVPWQSVAAWLDDRASHNL